MVPVFVVKPESLVRSLTFVGIVGLFTIYASDVESVTDQSDCTFTSAPVAIPASLVFSVEVIAI